MTRTVRLLLVEDSASDAKLIEHSLRRAGWEVVASRVETAEAMRTELARGEVNAILSDWSMPRFSGAAALALLNELGLDVPFIIVSGTVGEESAVEAMRAGARDYVIKDRLGRLAPVLERELAEAQARLEQRKSQEALRRTEEQLRQAQKLEAIGGLAAGVAHDFNNLLSVVLGTCELLQGDLSEEVVVREGLDDIRQAGLRAAQLTQQLLAFARRQVLQPRDVDLGEVVASVGKMLRRLLGEDIEVVLPQRRSLGKVFVDPGQIEQVILNLAVNARDAMPRGGTLIIETVNTVMDIGPVAGRRGHAASACVMLAVSDTGVGMDAATQARIFEPFFTTKVKGKGTGLGLSTVFGIVEQSGGTIWVYSEVGRGTTFKLYFPESTHREERKDSEPPGGGADLRGRETVLLVEDDESVRKTVHTILRRYGYQVLLAGDGEQAIEISGMHTEPIALLLTDVIMPRMSGRELSEGLCGARPGLRTLYMSGFTDDSIVHHGVLDPGIAFLQKPIMPSVLARKVREVLDAPQPIHE